MQWTKVVLSALAATLRSLLLPTLRAVPMIIRGINEGRVVATTSLAPGGGIISTIYVIDGTRLI